MERLTGDLAFRTELNENLDNPRKVTEHYGIEVDPLEMLPLWRRDYMNYRSKPECSSWPLAVIWYEYIDEMIRHRDMLRDEGEMAMVAPRFHVWRERQIRRCNSEVGSEGGDHAPRYRFRAE